MSDDRPGAYWDEERGCAVYRASAVGGCSRALLTARWGIEGQPPPAWLQERFDEGTRLEGTILERVAGWDRVKGVAGRVKFRRMDVDDGAAYADLPHVRPEFLDPTGQHTLELPGGPGWIIRGHLDGILQVYVTDAEFRAASGLVLGDRVVAEAKKFRESLWDKWVRKGISAFPGYECQLSIAMAATGLPGLFIVGQYVEDAPWEIGEVHAQLFHTAPVGLGTVMAKLAKIEMRVRRGEMLDTCDQKMWPCPFYDEYHRGEEDPDVVRVEPAWEERFDALAGWISEGKENQKRGKALVDQYRPEFEALIEGQGMTAGKEGLRLRSSRFDVLYRVEEVPESTSTRKAHRRVTVQPKQRVGGG